MLKLEFGLNHGVPDTPTAWGARLIIDQRGRCEMLPDRKDLQGPDRAELAAALNKILPQLLDRIIPKLLRTYVIDWKEKPEEVGYRTLFEDDQIEVRGTPNGSYGYLYVRAWLKRDVKEAPCATTN